MEHPFLSMIKKVPGFLPEAFLTAKGVLYSGVYEATDLATGKNYVQIKTPADKEVHFRITGGGSTQGPVNIKKYKGANLTNGTTPVPLFNRKHPKHDAGDTPDTEVYSDPSSVDVSGLDSFNGGFIPAGGKSVKMGSVLSLGFENILSAGTDYVIEIDNQSGGTIDILKIGFEFFEVAK